MASQEIIVIKIGTSSITDIKSGVDYKTINLLAKAVAELKAQGHTLVIVSSGAMSLGICKLGLDHSHSGNVAYKQALTSVGQVSLMNAYDNIFKYYGYSVGQVLITHKGLDDKERNDCIKGTFENIFKLGVIPVVNANACFDEAAPRKRSNAASHVLSIAAEAIEPPAASDNISASSAPANAIGASFIKCLSASHAPLPASITSFCNESANVTSEERRSREFRFCCLLESSPPLPSSLPDDVAEASKC